MTALLRRGLPTLLVADESRDVVMVPHRHKDQIPFPVEGVALETIGRIAPGAAGRRG